MRNFEPETTASSRPLAPEQDTPAAGLYLTTRVPDESTAWSKARRDMGQLLRRFGYSTVPLPASWHPGQWLGFVRDMQARLPSGGHLLIEYPFEQRKRAFLLRFLSKRRDIRLYALIHDLDSLRNDDSPVEREIAILKLFDGLISHTGAMTHWLRDQGLAGTIRELELFDYCAAPGPAWHDSELSSPLKVAFAGNLLPSKAGFIYDARLAELPGVQLALYGPYFEAASARSAVTCLGVFDPDQPALKDPCHFGLVWDGHDLDSCDGKLGRYMRYNVPHKLSLYLALGLPVVVWSEAAAAQTVRDRGIGLTVRSLRELGEIPARLSASAYREMAANAVALGREVRRGAFLHQALRGLAG